MHNYENGALLRIEPVRPVRDNTMYECLAENGVGDAVSAEAQLRVYEGTYLPPSPFLFSTLTIIRAKLVDSKGLETARDPIPLYVAIDIIGEETVVEI